MNNKIVLTGIKPTGIPHLGNLVGVIDPLIKLSYDTKRTFAFIADLHALNDVKARANIKSNTYEVAISMLAFNPDPEKFILFRQSDIAEVSQLSSLLMNVTSKGLMNKAHAYKAFVDKNIANGFDKDAGINMGLFTYPILMAADILLYNADLVPLGQDQRQHLEFTRDIAAAFNHAYKENVFKLPEALISEKTGIMMPGLDGRKMSKSYDNYINIFCAEDVLKKKIMKIKTDSKTPAEPKNPDESIIFAIYQNFASPDETKNMRDRFLNGGLGYGTAKQELFELINSRLKGLRNIYQNLINDKKHVDNVLKRGAEIAGEIAQKNLKKVKQVMLG
ncbi:MAG: tryptophan--tRNA ligase [Deltaproteobacteria bacterium]|jgi:tryptophanyl-tRNA synthetase|nr:tryptophan--tRNA ligase [Deltaproteobacteria bacterium]